MRSAHDASVLLQAGPANHGLQVVELGEPRPILLQKNLHGVSFLRVQVFLMKKLPIKYIPGHELTGLPGKAARTVDQCQSGEATDEEGAELHSPRVDVIKL